MTKSLGWALAGWVALSIAIPASGFAQEPPKKPVPARPAPAARPAPRPAPVARPAAPAPHIAAPARPAPAPRVAAPPRPAPHIAAPAQRAAPRVVNHPAAPAHIAAPAANRAAERAARRAGRTATPAVTPAASPAAAKVAAPAAAARTLTRTEQRQERAAERSALRGVPRAQRAERLQQFRTQRAAQRQNAATPSAAAPAAATTNARSATRLNGAARVNAQAARQGRFASRFQARRAAAAAAAPAQAASFAAAAPAFAPARRAWREHRRAGFTPWFGPVFYPYAYSDIFDYAFWPVGYDEGYWDYAYDDFFDGVFYGDATPVMVGKTARPASRPSYAAVQQLCKQPGNGVTAWPFDDISAKVGLNGDQKALLDDMKAAAKKAAQTFAASCPAENAAALTPPGRLQAMTVRLEATQEAVQTVKPALDKFYASLSDEQKERFNLLGPQNGMAPQTETTASASADQDKSACGEPKPGLTNLPMEQIEDAVKPNGTQEADLNKLEDATGQAVAKLAAACPADTPLTPPGRLDAMSTRLDAMVDAAKTVKPALDTFYGSLTSEQKARFDAIGRTLAKNDAE